jgi:hypothetical protein
VTAPAAKIAPAIQNGIVNLQSKLHQFDDRKTFKEEWIKWRKEEENDLLINLDIERLTIGGYVGNIEEKIFKSVRYYFKKRNSLCSNYSF